MLNNGGQFVGGVADALVVGERDSIFGAAVFQPLFICAIGREQVVMPLDGQPGSYEDVWKALT